MGNANYYYSSEYTVALLQNLNHLLKQVIDDSDFKETTPFFLKENLG